MRKHVALLLLSCGLLVPSAASAKRAEEPKPAPVEKLEKPAPREKLGKTEADERAGKEAPVEKSGKPVPVEKTGKTAAIAKLGKKERAPKEKAPCFAPEVHVVRKRGDEIEYRDLSLTMCDGTVNPAALDSVSVLARPRDAERPLMPEIKAYQRLPVDRGPRDKRRTPGFLTRNVMRVDPGLLLRLQRVANRWPGRTIEIISGHRPDARDTSRHHHGRALDMRVDGVSREALRDFLRKFEETGVGYYPNSYFVHMDVRDDRGYWVDRSGPGEAPDYGRWPPPKQEVDRASAKVVNGALAELAALQKEIVTDEGFITERDDDAEKSAPKEREHRKASRARSSEEAAPEEDGDLNADEIERIRQEAIQAIQAL